MIDPEYCATELQRMWRLDFFPHGNTPGDAAALKELRLALEPAATEAIARQVVTDWLANYGEAPKPADLRHMVRAANDAAEVASTGNHPSTREFDAWKAMGQQHGIFKRGRDPQADIHLDLLKARAEELRRSPALRRFGPDGWRPETELSKQLAAVGLALLGKGPMPEVTVIPASGQPKHQNLPGSSPHQATPWWLEKMS